MELTGANLLADSLTAKLLLAIASTVIVGYKSHGSNDHIVLSHSSEGISRNRRSSPFSQKHVAGPLPDTDESSPQPCTLCQ
jgi:hypothetical protein